MISHKKMLEEHLMHVEKLATAGQMAAELAHEIRNQYALSRACSTYV